MCQSRSKSQDADVQGQQSPESRYPCTRRQKRPPWCSSERPQATCTPRWQFLSYRRFKIHLLAKGLASAAESTRWALGPFTPLLGDLEWIVGSLSFLICGAVTEDIVPHGGLIVPHGAYPGRLRRVRHPNPTLSAVLLPDRFFPCGSESRGQTRDSANVCWMACPRASPTSSRVPFSSVPSAPTTRSPLLPWTSLFSKRGPRVGCNSCSGRLRGLTWQPLLSRQVSAQMSPPWGGGPRLDNLPLSYKTRLCFLHACINLGGFLAHLRTFRLPPSAGRGALENNTLLSSMALSPAPRLTRSKSPPKRVEWMAGNLPSRCFYTISLGKSLRVGSEKCPHVNSFHGTLIFFRRGAFSGSGPFTA